MDLAVKQMLDYLRSVMSNPERAKLNPEELPEEFREFGRELLFFGECVMANQKLAEALSKGKLDIDLPSQKNALAFPLKALHATLKHLTWQAHQVSQGDYQQRVVFMGEFAEAFNTMAQQLECQRRDLLEEIEAGRRKTRALKQSNSLLEAITRGISQWIVVMDRATSEWLFVNRGADGVLQDMGSELQLRQWMTEQAENVPDQFYSFCTELELEKDNGSQYFTVEVHPLDWHGIRGIAFVFTDISLERQHLYYLEKAAYHDRLTQVYNRHFGMDLLNKWLDNHTVFTLCFVDMDNLKCVNDQFGHSVGDKYILAVTEVLQDFSPEAVLCRLGGDEFMLLIEHWGRNETEKRMETLRNRLLQEHNTSNGFCDYSISYGVVEVDNDLTAGDLLSIADERMYAYKRAYKAKLREGRTFPS